MTNTEFLDKLEHYIKRLVPNHYITLLGYTLYIDFIAAHYFEENDVTTTVCMINKNSDEWPEEPVVEIIAQKWVEVCKNKGIIK